MPFFDDVLTDLLQPSPPKGSSDEARIEALTKDVEKLRRVVAALAQMLHENDAFGRLDRDTIRERFARALRIERPDDPIPEGDTTKCGPCGKMLYEDDPELTLQDRGRVCMSCFQRGG
jgi:hypothetical protein